MKSANAYEVFLDVYLNELIESSNAEILDGVNAENEKAAGLSLLAAAKAEAGRRRLAQARAAMAEEKTTDYHVKPDVTADEARHFLRVAVNDRRFTLAARQLDELSDEDVLRAYFQVRQLQTALDDGSNKNK